MDKRHELGRMGEEIAAAHLVKQGYLVVERNLTNCLGELDLVALDGSTVVVVEVKTRAKLGGRTPSEAVNFQKQRKLTMVAALFLKTRRWENRPTRFDVVEVICPPQAQPLINHIKNAFEAVGY